MRLVREGAGGPAWLDVAVSDALLRRVARRELPATARLYVPAATIAFGRLDALHERFADAVAAASAHGFEPVVRSAGGRAAAYSERAVVYEEITPHDGVALDVRARFEPFSALLARALASLGVDARVGEVPGEYCPGAFSVNADGALKLAGVAQRVIRGAALTAAVVVVGDGPRVRAALAAVYRALGVPFAERSAGALDEVAPGAEATAVAEAVLAERERDADLEPAALDAATLAVARELGRHHRLV